MKEMETQNSFIRLLIGGGGTSLKGLSTNGAWEEDPQIVKEEVRSYFKRPYSKEHWDRPNFKQISHEHKSFFSSIFKEEELKEVVQKCGNHKSLGSDGFNFRFIKSFWDTLKEDVM